MAKAKPYGYDAGLREVSLRKAARRSVYEIDESKEDWNWRRSAIIELRSLLSFMEPEQNTKAVDEYVNHAMVQYIAEKAMVQRFLKNHGEYESDELKSKYEKYAQAIWAAMKLETGGIRKAPALIHGCIRSARDLEWAKRNGLVMGRDEKGRTLLSAMCDDMSGSLGNAVAWVICNNSYKWQKQTKECAKSLIDVLAGVGGSKSLSPSELFEVYESLKDKQPAILYETHIKKSIKVVKNEEGVKRRVQRGTMNSFMVTVWRRLAYARRDVRIDSANANPSSEQLLERLLINLEEESPLTESHLTAINGTLENNKDVDFKSVLSGVLLRRERKLLRMQAAESGMVAIDEKRKFKAAL